MSRSVLNLARRSRGRSPALAGAGFLTLVVCLGVQISACASYTTRLRHLRETVTDGRLEDALEQVEEGSDPGDLLYHLERGALLHYAGQPGQSNLELETCEALIDDLFTISLSKRGLTFLLNDEVEAYRGEVHEGNYLHYFRALNFLRLEDWGASAVEARRLAQHLAMLRDSGAEDSHTRDDPFLEYFAGVVLESYGEWNSALIAYRLANEAWADPATACGTQAPPWLSHDMWRTARRAGIRPEEIGLSEPESASGSTMRVGEDPNQGGLLILFESGWSPRKVSTHLRLPIFVDDPDWSGDEGATEAGWILAERYRWHQRHGAWARGKKEIAYFLDVAIPILVEDQESEAVACRVTLARIDSSAASTRRPGPTATSIPVSDLTFRVDESFKMKQPAVLAKTFARSLLKYLAQREAKKQGGDVAGVLVNIAGLVTEKADTRSWLMLPADIHAVRSQLPPGQYAVRLEALDRQGQTVDRKQLEIEIKTGQVQIVSWRSFS